LQAKLPKSRVLDGERAGNSLKEQSGYEKKIRLIYNEKIQGAIYERQISVSGIDFKIV